MEIDKTYNPQNIEQKWYKTWEESGAFSSKGETTNNAYSIILPPPNVTGSLHMGHAFQDSIMDALIRYNRMKGKRTLWQPGTDHASIATQMIVERRLQKQGISKHDLGREKFLEKVWEWKEESGSTITKQMRRLGTSVDWEREKFTMDPELCEIVSDVFIKLYDEGLIYRGKRLANWDPILKTAISDLEVLSEEEQGSLWHISYPIKDSEKALTVATTRPETMLGDAAIAVNPEDERYKDLVGKFVILPLCDREIPIIADDYVDREFGTGCVKITPAHDFNDYEVGQRHNLPLINILTNDAKINEQAPEKYQGLDRFVARKEIIKDLEAQGRLVKIEPHTLKVPRGDRSQTIIEPMLTDQWFVDAKELAKDAISVVENKEVQFVPQNWEKTYFEWMRNIEDWCISRQLWWGHRIPAWFDDAGNIYVAKTKEDAKRKYSLADDVELSQDDDVLDTWFSSALWAFSTLEWPEDSDAMKTFFPTSVLVTGFDIIFFWVARMIMMSKKLTGKVPFKEVYIHGIIRDQDGQKMSKTKGNILDPLDIIDGIEPDKLIEKRVAGLVDPKQEKKIIKDTKKHFPDGISSHGTDALRFTFYSLATHGRHLNFDMKRAEGYRNFCNKLWNASRYIFMNTESVEVPHKAVATNSIDKWILTKWQETKDKIEEYYQNYRFDLLSHELYDFVWHKFCDWYLELTKPILNSDDQQAKQATQANLLFLLDEILKVTHPLMPYITEEIWQKLHSANGKLLMISKYPSVDASVRDEMAAKQIEAIIEIVTAVRNIKGEANVSPAKEVSLYLQNTENSDETIIKSIRENDFLLSRLVKAKDILWLNQNESAPASAFAYAANLKVLIPLQGLVDKEAETARTVKMITKLSKEKETIAKKLKNPGFTNKAPQEVIELEQGKLDALIDKLDKLNEHLKMLDKID